MRTELLYTPSLLFSRIGEIFTERSRLRSLRGTKAASLSIYHIDSLELLKLIASENSKPCIYDIGANHGTWGTLAKTVLPESRVIGFEPVRAHLEHLNSKMNDIGYERIIPFACSDKSQMIEMFITPRSDSSSLLKPTKQGEKEFHLSVNRLETIECRPIDQLVRDYSLPQPQLLKLDIQGSELLALKGATNTLVGVDWVLSEVSFKSFYEDQVLFSELAGWLSAQSFEVFAFGSSTVVNRQILQTDVLFRRI